MDGADVGGGETWTCEVATDDGETGAPLTSDDVDVTSSGFAWTRLADATESMVTGSCGSAATTTAVCDASVSGQLVFIVAGSTIEAKELGNTDRGVTARGAPEHDLRQQRRFEGDLVWPRRMR